MHPERVTYLLQQYLDNLLSNEELDELMKLMTDDRTSGMVNRAMEDLLASADPDGDYNAAEWDPLFNHIMAKAEEERPPLPMWTIGAVAAAVLLLAAGVWLLWRKEAPASLAVRSAAQQPAGDRAPGGDKAVLTLADGSSIPLDDAKEGVVGTQGSARVVKTKNAQLRYENGEASQQETAVYNVLTTPRGGQYKLELPDGTKVWLNAASSLRYPVRFVGDERVVELKGEGYFEVAKDARKPFKVSVVKDLSSDPMLVEVLGTHFNIMAYGDEPVIRTTLLEGSIRVKNGLSKVSVMPGQAAELYDKGMLTLAPGDVEQAVAWKEGMFRFNKAGIEEVMRQLSRWYDMDVVYVNGIPKDRFQGEMYRNVSVMKVLKVLEASGVHFSVEGKRLLVRQ